jgi:WD40 repeat protein
MTKKIRTILFLIFLFLFLLITPAAVFYSQGYRIDFENRKISQTGGLFLSTLPKQAEIYLDEKLEKRTDFFFGSALIENLLPKKYKIEIKKEGCHSWEKTLEIKEKEVVEVRNIVLFPKDLNFHILISEVKDFWFSPDQRKIVLRTPTFSPPDKEIGWALKLYELDKEVKSHLIEKGDVSSGEVDLLNLKFSEDSKEIYLEVGTAEQLKYFTLNLEETPPALSESETPKPPLENAVVYQKVNNDIYYLDNSGYLFKNEEKLTREPFPVKKETEYALEIFQNFIFLQEKDDLYKLNQESKSFEKFFEGINALKVSPDFKKLVYFSDYEIWILFLRESEENLFLIRLSEKIRDVSWLNSNYLIFNSGDKIKIAEIDTRDRINVIDIAELKNPRIFWNEIDKRLYVLSEENLYRSRALLP